MTEHSELVANHVRKISHYEGITDGQASVLREAAHVLTEQAAMLKKLRDEFRDYKIVHPEGKP